MSKSNALILISNTALPSTRIGSWVTRMNSLLERHPIFDYILSPTTAANTNVYAKKRKFISYLPLIRKQMLTAWVAKDYVKAVKKIAKNHDKITIVVMDDPHLVAAMVHIKPKLACKVNLIFSFHGFRLSIDEILLERIDQVLFLSDAGRLASIAAYKDFKPKATVVWNGVSSEKFYPLSSSEKTKLRESLGFKEQDKLVIWMANDRPLKGFSILQSMADQLLQIHENVKIITIGTTQQIDSEGVFAVGRLPHDQIPRYLQIGNVYLFTSLYEEGFGLSMIEALKCGNEVIATNNGAIPNVLADLPKTHIVQDAKDTTQWLSAVTSVFSNPTVQTVTNQETDSIWSYSDWEKRFIDAILT